MRMGLPDATPMSRAEVIAGMQQNQHVWPWGIPARWRAQSSVTLKWLILAALAWRWRDRFSKELQRLWLAALGCALLAGFSHVLGGVLKSPFLLNLIGLRAAMWLSVVSLPVVMVYWMEHIRRSGWAGSRAAWGWLGSKWRLSARRRQRRRGRGSQS